MSIVLDGTTGITTPALDSTAKFASADMPVGSVLQVVQGSTTTQLSSSTTTYVDSTLTATITPTSATSKILVIVTQCYYKAGTNSGVKIKLFRDATDLGVLANNFGYTGTSIGNVGAAAFQTLDTPNTTSPVTYKTQFANSVAASTVQVQASDGFSNITLMEIAA